MTLQLGGTARKARGPSRAESVDVVVIGAGQAGLSLSHELSQADVEHVVLDRGRVGQTWRTRWDSFCLLSRTGPCSCPAAATTAGILTGSCPEMTCR